MKKLLAIIVSLLVLVNVNPLQAVAGDASENNPLALTYGPGMEGLASDLYSNFMLKGEAKGAELITPDQLLINDWLRSRGHMALLREQDSRGLSPLHHNLFEIGREVYVPIMNPANPVREKLSVTGLSPQEFSKLFGAGEKTSWGALSASDLNIPVQCYLADQNALMLCLEEFMEGTPKLESAAVVESCSEVVSRVQSDIYALGFCSLDQLMKLEEKGELSSIALVPVDQNNNNELDHFEQIYGSLAALQRGVWIGKYPPALYTSIYLVNASGNMSAKEMDFLTFLLNQGQEVLASAGFSGLLERERQDQLAAMDAPLFVPVENEAAQGNGPLILIIGSVVLILGLLVFLVLKAFDTGVSVSDPVLIDNEKGLLAQSLDLPGGYYFDRSHTWAFMEKTGELKLGIDSFLPNVTGKLTRLELKSEGEKVKRGELLLTMVQNGKRINIKSPLTGIIRERNSLLSMNAEALSEAPFENGWVYIIEAADWKEEVPFLIDGHTYRTWLSEEYARLKDFLAGIFQEEKSPAFALQEGGDIKAGILEELGPRAWEDFQSDFLNLK